MIIDVQLRHLIPGGDINSRSSADLEGIMSLANSIAQLGLILPLSVMSEGDGINYRIIDGNRRFEALKIVEKDNDIVMIPCLLQEHDNIDLAIEQSLAANIERVPLHPMDQWEAFAKMQGSVNDIADHFGITQRQVKARMALGSLCDLARSLYRADEIDDRLARLLTKQTHERQEELIGGSEPAWRIVQLLESEREKEVVKPGSPLARFVTFETYRDNGGQLVDDLFVPQHEQDWKDVQMANRLAAEKMLTLNNEALADGWAWFEATERYVGEDYTCDYGEYEEFTADEKAELGVVIDGNYQITYGCRRRDKGARAQEYPDAGGSEPKDKPISQSLLDDMDHALTNAAAHALASSPAFANRLLVLQFLSDYSEFTMNRSWMLGASVHGHAFTTLPLTRMEELVKKSGLRKAKNFEGKVKALWKLDDVEVFEILAWFVGKALTRRNRSDELILYMDKAGTLEIGKHWKSTPETYYSRLSKDQLTRLCVAEGIELDTATMKKSEIVTVVARKLGEDYIPEQLRPQAKPSHKVNDKVATDQPEDDGDQ